MSNKIKRDTIPLKLVPSKELNLDNVIENVGRRVVIEKTEDTKFKGEHPNGINVGYVLEGYMFQEPEVGKPVGVIGAHFRGIVTSTVQKVEKIPTGWKVETQNSKYKIENYEDND